MKIKKLSIIALALSFVLLISCNSLSPVSAREQQHNGVSKSSASGKEFAEIAEALAPRFHHLNTLDCLQSQLELLGLLAIPVVLK